MRRKTHGFTLIELLVVIAIIGLLGAMLMPAISATRERARQVACRSNLKQIGTAVVHFTEDNNMCLPLAYDDETGLVYTDFLNIPYVVQGPASLKTRTEQITYSANLRRTGKLNGVFYCPNAPSRISPSYGVNAVSDVNIRDAQGNPGTHPEGLTRRKQGTKYAPISINEIGNPATMIYLADSVPGEDFWHVGQGHSAPPDPKNFSDLDRRHSGRFCVLYLDGHSDYYGSDRPNDWVARKPQW